MLRSVALRGLIKVEGLVQERSKTRKGEELNWVQFVMLCAIASKLPVIKFQRLLF